jgi:TRAP-type C4-dicarboxylate transport system permease small subunit
MLKSAVNIIDRLSKLGVYLSFFLLIAIIILIVTNIVLMNFFNSSIMITDEYSAYMFAAFVMFGLSYTLKENAHIRITVISSKLPKNVQKLLKLTTTLIALLISLFAAYHSGIMVYQAYIYQMKADTVAQTLIYIPQLSMPIGFFALALQLISEFLKELQ